MVDPEDVHDAQHVDNNTGNGVFKVEMPLNSLMTEICEGSNIEELTQFMFAHIKTIMESPHMPESGFTLNQITHLYINFYKLAFARQFLYSVTKMDKFKN